MPTSLRSLLGGIYNGANGASGASGTSGTSGVSGVGISGTSGVAGTSGTSGTSGVAGQSGTSGVSGAGTSGTSGTSGYSGTSGANGVSGFSGTSGTSGTSGVAGQSGTSGVSGAGTSGTSGVSGAGTSGTSGVAGQSGTSGVSGYSGVKGNNSTVLMVAVSDESTPLTTGTAKLTFRTPFAMNLTSIPRATLSTASTSGNVVVDINQNSNTILSTKLTIDTNELSSTGANIAAVLSNTSLADDVQITIDIDQAGTGAKGLKVTFYYTPT